ncbi:MAG: ATP phosphoribosyltransferase [Balneolales bacterium]
MKSKTSLRIAIQKGGRLSEKTIDLLDNIGLEFDGYKNRLMVPCKNFDVELLLIRDDDIPEYVQDGVCELGFVGENVTAEKRADVTTLRNLGYGECRLSVAVPKSSNIQSISELQNLRIATSYPNLTKDYFEERGYTVKIIPISGAVEIAPRLDVADAICDLVSTGGTLKSNGLEELEVMLQSECQLIQTNKAIPDEKQQLIDKFLVRIQARQQAERSRYILMNARVEDVDKVCRMIPSLNSPTVLPLADPNMRAIHSVISINEFWEVMEKLKEAGATGIVILPIENMIV